MTDLLFELFSEEIPARMQAQASEELVKRLTAALDENRLEYGEITPFVTPRRLAVKVSDMADTQPDREVERKGPKVNAPEGAISGFCRSVGMEVGDLEVRSKGDDEFYFAVIREKGKSAAVALKDILEALLADFPWPKSQRWGDYGMHWVRPLRNIMCLFGDEVVPVQFGHLSANNITFGHRFLAPDPIVIDLPKNYESKLEAAHVVACADKRRDAIAEQAAAAALKQGISIKPDDGLLAEVNGLVEWPTCLIGQFEEDFLALPPEVLILEMKHHQKYFACLDGESKLSRYFLLVSNMVAKDDGAKIVHGNQRVLRARLEDGRFYWEQDKHKPLEAWRPALEKMIFHAKLGSVAEKADRIASLAAFLAIYVPHANLEKAGRVAKLCKSDLVSGMVGEFPELQGVMGRYYALEQGEEADVADAIRDHYKPAGAEDDVPNQPLGITVALADKLDSLVGLFAAGEKPTGSKDPFALRRAALGIIRIIFDNQLRLPLKLAIENAMSKYPSSLFKGQDKDALVQELLGFFSDRIKVLLKEDGVRHDLIEAVFDGGSEDDIVRLVARVRALEAFLVTDDGANLLAAYTRAGNIVAKEEKKDNVAYDKERPDADLLIEDPEKELFEVVERLWDELDTLIGNEDDDATMKALVSLRAPVDTFFEEVTVNAEDADTRRNRLRMLANVRTLMNRVANFKMIEG